MLPPLLDLDRVGEFLDEHGFGSGPIQRTERIAEGGGANFTFLLERDEGRYVLRRPPRPPLPPSAHDMVREARLQLALAQQGIRVPPIVAVGDDESVLGVPFYVMEFVEGTVVLDELPPVLDEPSARRAVALDLVDTLAAIHAVDIDAPGLQPFQRPGSYLERQVRRWQQLWGINATRDLPVPELGEHVAAAIPEPLPNAVVHGDYPIGNVIVADDEPRIPAVLDWEMGAIGDPRADVGYLVATYMEPGGRPTALGSARATAAEGFPSRAELVERYEQRTGRRVERLGWFEALAWWKAAVFCEAIYGRYVRGELGEAPQAARFEEGVPLMVESAFEALQGDSG